MKVEFDRKSEHIRQEVETFPSVFLATNNQNMSTEMFVAKTYSDDWFKKWLSNIVFRAETESFQVNM